MADIKPHIRENAAKLEKKTEFAMVDGQLKVTVDPEAYLEFLPEGMSAETFQQAIEVLPEIGFASTLLVAEKSLPFMQKHKDLANAQMVVPLPGKDRIIASVNRERKFPTDEKSPDGKAIMGTTYGAATFEVDIYSSHNSRGQLNAIRKEITSKYLEAFNN